VGDSDVKTEATLRARMEKAADCSPCILLLRHIEALAKNAQTLETGKGSSLIAWPFDVAHQMSSCYVRTAYGKSPSGLLERSETNVDSNWLPGVRVCYIHRIREGVSRSAKLLQARGSLRGLYLETYCEKL
jgi:hypothetical protein